MSKRYSRLGVCLLLLSVLFVGLLPSLAQRTTSSPAQAPMTSPLAIRPGHRFFSSDEYEERTASCDATATGIQESVRLYAAAKVKKGSSEIHTIERVWGSWPNTVALDWPLFALKGHLHQFANVRWVSNRAEIGMEGSYDVINDRGEPIGPLHVKAACWARW